MAAAIVLACLGLSAGAIGIWWFVAVKAPQPQAASPVPAAAQPPAQLAKASVDPALVGSFEHDSVIDDYDWRFVYSIAPDGTYRLVTTQEEAGTYRAANDGYRTVALRPVASERGSSARLAMRRSR
jgi:hypothetical protein